MALGSWEKFIDLVSKKELLEGLNVGIERECLRTDLNGKMSQKFHPEKLGRKLTHPFITTDYSEALLEFITPVFSKKFDSLDFLKDFHSYVYSKLDDELMWPASMPSWIPSDKDIAVANFGQSNSGKLKELYRIGLGYRYGKSMQSIAGVHFNFSLADELVSKLRNASNDNLSEKEFRNDLYFSLIRNFRRYSWLLVYLFGASPVADESFLEGKEHSFKELGPKSYGLPYATSLRMGGFGYTSDAQKEIAVCFNKLETYIKSLERARLTSYPEYEKIGLKADDGTFKQLNVNLLQIDNEYYSHIRPKFPAKSGQSALQALWENGIEYIEVRILDVDPMACAGLSEQTYSFLKSFLLFCLFKDSPRISSNECERINENISRVVIEGRLPGLKLKINETEEVPLKDYGNTILDEIALVAKSLGDDYLENVLKQKEKIEDPTLTPSAKILESIKNKSFKDVMTDLAKKHKEKLLSRELSSKLVKDWDEATMLSVKQEEKIVEGDKESFDDYLKSYFEQIRIKE